MRAVQVRLREWKAAGPDTPGLRGADLGGRAARELAASLRAEGVIEVVELREGVHVKAFAHVGRIQLGEIQITVEPKQVTLFTRSGDDSTVYPQDAADGAYVIARSGPEDEQLSIVLADKLLFVMLEKPGAER